MASVIHKKGKLREFQAQISFGLNFEDKRQSVKVTEGDLVQFDGESAVYEKNGEEFSGKSPSLKSAIASDWLIPTDGEESAGAEEPVSEQESAPKAPSRNAPGKQFDARKGGNFNEFIHKEQRSEVITEKDQVVKNFEVKTTEDDSKGTNLELAGDQVAVKENFVVGSSTTVPRSKKHSTEVSSSDHYGADRTIDFKSKKMASQEEQEKKPEKKTFTVDATTPRLNDDATQDEVKRATEAKKVEAESQEATVVGQIGKKNKKMSLQEPQDAKVVGKIGEKKEEVTREGITLRKTESKKEMTLDTQVGAPGEMTMNTQVGSSGETAVDVNSENAEEVSKGDEKKTRKKKTAKKKTSRKKSTKKASTKKAPVKNPDGSSDYLSMMPDDWSDLHWVKKEKFILGLDDPEFVEFILRVETVNAVQNACKKRLEELGQATVS